MYDRKMYTCVDVELDQLAGQLPNTNDVKTCAHCTFLQTNIDRWIDRQIDTQMYTIIIIRGVMTYVFRLYTYIILYQINKNTYTQKNRYIDKERERERERERENVRKRE